jgi:hypothetical protein
MRASVRFFIFQIPMQREEIVGYTDEFHPIAYSYEKANCRKYWKPPIAIVDSAPTASQTGPFGGRIGTGV